MKIQLDEEYSINADFEGLPIIRHTKCDNMVGWKDDRFRCFGCQKAITTKHLKKYRFIFSNHPSISEFTYLCE